MHTFSLRVYYEDTDSGGVVYHANYLKFIERARSEIFFAAGRLPEGPDGLFVVSGLKAKFLAPARLGEALDVTTEPVELKGASMVLRQKVWYSDRMLFWAEVKLAFIKEGRPARIKDEFIPALFREARY